MRYGSGALSCSDEGEYCATIMAEELWGSEMGSARGPERALMIALLFDGVMTCMNYAGSHSKSCRAKFQESLHWVLTRGAEYVFSFDNICECLGINADALRIGLINACNSRNGNEKKARRTF